MVEQLQIDRLGMETARVGLLLNPLSGRIRKHIDVIRHMLSEIPAAACREVTSAAEIGAAVDAFLQADIDLLVIIGGDGTVQAVLTHLFTTRPVKWPVLTIVPGGTTNMTALDLGIHGKPEVILRRLSNCLSQQISPILLQRPVLCIEQPGANRIYGMFFGVGLIAHAVIFSRSKVKRLGITGEIYSGIIMLGYLAGVIFGRKHGPWAPVQMTITEASGAVRNGTYLVLFASALDRLLFSMRPYWGREREPLHVTFVEQQRNHPWRALWLLLSGHSDAIKEQDGYHSHNTSVLELLMDDDYIIDGEFHRATSQDGPLRISAAGPVTFLVPSNKNTDPRQ
jgi:diacylglycerol kinase (ATP)